LGVSGNMFCPISIVVYFLSVAIGLVMFFRPGAVIEFQKKFYEKINWRIEPISMSREVRNTRLMGLFLIFAVPLAIIYILNLRYSFFF
jgi:hypothetical protein